MCVRPSRDSSILPEELATQSVRLKEEQLRREEEKVSTTAYDSAARSRFHCVLAAGDRTPSAKGDQREEAGTPREGRIAQVCEHASTI